jgi:hypothetical protein
MVHLNVFSYGDMGKNTHLFTTYLLPDHNGRRPTFVIN